MREAQLVFVRDNASRQRDTLRMAPQNHAGAVAETHFNDLQAEVEAGSRKIDQIEHDAARIRETLMINQLDQAALMGALIRRIGELKDSVRQQRVTMGELRHDIRKLLDTWGLSRDARR
jgi:hypothetical protein